MAILSRSAFNRLRDQYWRQQRTPRPIEGAGLSQRDHDSDLIRFRNVSDAPMPLGTPIRVSGVPSDQTSTGDVECSTVGTTMWPSYLVCAEEVVMPGEYGIATRASRPTVVRYHASFTMGPNLVAGATDNGLVPGLPGFLVLGVIDAYYVWAIQQPILHLHAQAQSSIGPGEAATVAVLRRNYAGFGQNLWMRTSLSVTARDIWLNDTESLPTGARLLLSPQFGEWLIIQAYCDPRLPDFPSDTI